MGSVTGTQRQGRAESPREVEGAARGPTHLAFVQSLLDHPGCAACVAGREVLHTGAGVADRVEVIRRAVAGLHAAWEGLQSRLGPGVREGQRVGLALPPSGHEPELP